MHVPVLLKEVMEALNPKPGEFFIDGTIGAGGHAKEILNRIGPKGRILGIDWDKRAIERLKNEMPGGRKIILVAGNYAELPEILKNNRLPKADGLVIDLGFSSDQLDRSGRGFSFLKDEVLDMRYSAENELTAAEVINSFPQKDLEEIFYDYGEERFSRKIAKAVIEERRKKKILTTGELVRVIEKSVPGNYEKGRIHPATRVFQALRIYVNRELENLEELLSGLNAVLKPKGRAAIISFHSLEDRIVKNYFRTMGKNGIGKIITKKPVTASKEEIAANPRSRSAKLRVMEVL